MIDGLFEKSKGRMVQSGNLVNGQFMSNVVPCGKNVMHAALKIARRWWINIDP